MKFVPLEASSSNLNSPVFPAEVPKGFICKAPADEEAMVILLSGLVVPTPNSLLVSFQNKSEKGVHDPPSL